MYSRLAGRTILGAVSASRLNVLAGEAQSQAQHRAQTQAQNPAPVPESLDNENVDPSGPSLKQQIAEGLRELTRPQMAEALSTLTYNTVTIMLDEIESFLNRPQPQPYCEVVSTLLIDFGWTLDEVHARNDIGVPTLVRVLRPERPAEDRARARTSALRAQGLESPIPHTLVKDQVTWMMDNENMDNLVQDIQTLPKAFATELLRQVAEYAKDNQVPYNSSLTHCLMNDCGWVITSDISAFQGVIGLVSIAPPPPKSKKHTREDHDDTRDGEPSAPGAKARRVDPDLSR